MKDKDIVSNDLINDIFYKIPEIHIHHTVWKHCIFNIVFRLFPSSIPRRVHFKISNVKSLSNPPSSKGKSTLSAL